MKISAHNALEGKVTEIVEGPVNSQVSVDLGGGTVVTSMITTTSVKRLGIEVGGNANVIIKASDVMLAVD